MASRRSSPATWTPQEDKLLELLLCLYPPGHARRWEAVAAHLSGKTAMDALERYQGVVADLERILGGAAVGVPAEWGLQKEPAEAAAGEPPGVPPSDGERAADEGRKKRKGGGERKKPEKWTPEEHRAFLEGLRRAGKGDWKTISREFVPTKSASQIASHSQKYHIRQEKKKRNESKRKSIHDITDPDAAAAGDDHQQGRR